MLSIILLTYNNLSSTKQCIEDLYKHTKNFQLIIIDNASTDGTVEYLKQLSKNSNIVVEYNANNQGIIKARNHGYQISKNLSSRPEYIFFIDNDQVALPGWQESYLEFFNKKYDIVGQIAWKMKKNYYPYKMIKDKTEEFNYVSCGGMMIKTSVIEDIELFDERFNFIYWEDPDFCFTAHNKGYKIGWNYNPVIEHQKHSLKLHRKRKKYFMENWKKFQDKWKDHKMPVFKMP